MKEKAIPLLHSRRPILKGGGWVWSSCRFCGDRQSMLMVSGCFYNRTKHNFVEVCRKKMLFVTITTKGLCRISLYDIYLKC